MYPSRGTLLSKYTYSYCPLFKMRIPQFNSFIVFNLYSVTMTTKIFVNLPIKDLNKTIDFFTKLGFKFNPQFTDENATCMIVGEDIFIMLLVETFFKTFTKKEIWVMMWYHRNIGNKYLK